MAIEQTDMDNIHIVAAILTLAQIVVYPVDEQKPAFSHPPRG